VPKLRNLWFAALSMLTAAAAVYVAIAPHIAPH
jgi:hypothetical protein